MKHYETSTAWWIAKDAIKPVNALNLRSKLSVLDFMDESQEIPTAYFERDGFITVPKIKLNILESILETRLITNKIVQDDKPSVDYGEMTIKPMQHQVQVIADAVHHFKTNEDKRVCLCAKPGFGKTYMSASIINRLQTKFIFIIYSAKLVSDTYSKFCEYLGSSGMFCMTSSSTFLEINWSKVKGLFITHTMLNILIKNYGLETVINTLQNKMGAELKVIDEYDRMVKSLYFIECWSNFKYSLYLTGTKYLNLRPNDRIFQMVYKHAKTVGHDVKLPSKRNSIIIRWNFSPTKAEYMKSSMNEGKMFKLTYNTWLARKDVLLDYIMKTFYKPEDSLMKKILNEGDSIIFYCGLIENCDIVKRKLINHFGIDPDKIGIYNSEVSKRLKEEAETKPFILTTTKSMGRGYDNSRIRILVFLEFNFGISDYEQNVSRVARVGGKEGWVIEGLDQSFGKIIMNHRKKVNEGTYDDLFKSVTYYSVPEVAYKYYWFGYRPEGEIATKLKTKKKR